MRKKEAQENYVMKHVIIYTLPNIVKMITESDHIY